MTPEQFLQRLAKNAPAAAYLFIGPDAYQRAACRRKLSERIPQVDHFDLVEDATLASVLDDARSLSLFSTERIMWVSGAEGALPKTRATDAADEDTAMLAAYMARPTEGVVLVFDCSRYEFDGEDKAKIERVQKFYAAIPEQVEFRPYTMESARQLAKDLARELSVSIGLAEIGLLVEVLAADGGRIATEIEKLALFAGQRKVTAEDIALLVPNARESTIFALVAALGRGDRKRSLDSLDSLVREGEYLPLVLTFLATQFRLALVAQESNLRSSQQVQTYFTRQGIRIWRDRAEQVSQTVTAFSRERLHAAIEKVAWADKALRDVRPDDRVVMEELVLALTV